MNHTVATTLEFYDLDFDTLVGRNPKLARPPSGFVKRSLHSYAAPTSYPALPRIFVETASYLPPAADPFLEVYATATEHQPDVTQSGSQDGMSGQDSSTFDHSQSHQLARSLSQVTQFLDLSAMCTCGSNSGSGTEPKQTESSGSCVSCDLPAVPSRLPSPPPHRTVNPAHIFPESRDSRPTQPAGDVMLQHVESARMTLTTTHSILPQVSALPVSFCGGPAGVLSKVHEFAHFADDCDYNYDDAFEGSEKSCATPEPRARTLAAIRQTYAYLHTPQHHHATPLRTSYGICEAADSPVLARLSTPIGGLVGYQPQTPDTDPGSSGSARGRRAQVKVACVHCKRSCKKCDEARPCGRCTKLGLAGSCSDAPRKERRLPST